jgi:hypothetical protein
MFAISFFCQLMNYSMATFVHDQTKQKLFFADFPNNIAYINNYVKQIINIVYLFGFWQTDRTCFKSIYSFLGGCLGGRGKSGFLATLYENFCRLLMKLFGDF